MVFITWFFVTAPIGILAAGKNLTHWAWNFFSIGFFVPRLFSPWHKDVSSYGRGFSFARFMQTLSWNLISRVIGLISRVAVIIIGLVVEGIFVSATAAAFIFWLISPAVGLILIILGIFTLSM